MSEGDVSEKYPAVQIGEQHYGISIANVIEIVQLQPSTELSELPCYARGVINLRGRVLPLIDVNLRFGKPEREYTVRTCIIIVEIDGLHMGLIVDAVEEVLDIDSGFISPSPTFSPDSDSRYVTGIANLEGISFSYLTASCFFRTRIGRCLYSLHHEAG